MHNLHTMMWQCSLHHAKHCLLSMNMLLIESILRFKKQKTKKTLSVAMTLVKLAQWHSRLLMFSRRTELLKYQSFVNICWVYSVTDIDLCHNNETQLISFASQMSPSQGNWNNTESHHTDMINGVLRLGSSGIYIISKGELAISIVALSVNSGSPVTSAFYFDCAALSSTLDFSKVLIKWLHR